jgi:hypothetical protein
MKKEWLFLGGIGLGAGLMYVLDPEQRRSHRIRPFQTLNPHWHRLAMLRNRTSRDVGGRTRRLLTEARGRLGNLEIPQRRFSQSPRRSGTSFSMFLLGCVGLGTALVYFLDPAQGKRRRDLVRDKGTSYWRQTNRAIGGASRHVGNRARGFVMETRARLRHEEIPEDGVLVARVRSEMGHVLTNPGAIGVTAVHGRVSLSGPVPADEVNQLLKTVGSIRGVIDLVNQLEVHDKTEHISGLQGKNN